MEVRWGLDEEHNLTAARPPVVRGSSLPLGTELGVRIKVVSLSRFWPPYPVKGVDLGGQVGSGEFSKL